VLTTCPGSLPGNATARIRTQDLPITSQTPLPLHHELPTGGVVFDEVCGKEMDFVFLLSE